MNNNFLQSKEWREFQESVGRKTFSIESENFHASIIEHNLPIVGKYFYIPKGPIFNFQFSIFNEISNFKAQISKQIQELTNLAEREKVGWIRIEPNDSNVLEVIRKNWRVVKAPHDMQPKETLIIDITKSEEEILAEMKSKTRYNIKLSQKHRVSVKAISNFKAQISNKIQNPNEKNSEYYLNEFLRLNRIMAKRQGIETHEDEYYRKMLETIPSEIIKLYVAEYQGKIIAANIMIFYGDTAIYLHGASDDQYKNVMAPYLLQRQGILDAKAAGCKEYDFNGVKVKNKIGKSWEGVTRFKLGFSPNTPTIEYPGSYDIIISPAKYWLYRIIQKIKCFIR